MERAQERESKKERIEKQQPEKHMERICITLAHTTSNFRTQNHTGERKGVDNKFQRFYEAKWK